MSPAWTCFETGFWDDGNRFPLNEKIVNFFTPMD